jgi:hypothetical protein
MQYENYFEKRSNHAKRYLKSTGDLLARRISPIIGFENSLP